MAKKKTQKQAAQPKAEKETVTLADQLGGDVLAKLKQAKQSLTAEAEQKEAEHQAQLKFERKQREKNMSFEELLNTYGNQGSKY